MSQANGFTFAVVNDAAMSAIRRGETGPVLSNHHNDVLAERAARRLARAAHGTGQTFWVVNIGDSAEHWGIESRCTGTYETRCAVCTAVLEALPEYKHDGEPCELCGEWNDSEGDYTFCVACRYDCGEFDEDEA